MPDKEKNPMKENSELQREDVQFTVICMIQSFFEENDGKGKLYDYLKDLAGLIDATNVFINQEFEDSVYSGDPEDFDSDEEVKDLEKLEDEVLTRAATLGDKYKPMRKKGTIGNPKTPEALKVSNSPLL